MRGPKKVRVCDHRGKGVLKSRRELNTHLPKREIVAKNWT